jgi:small conductance mechanosensitive channel
MTTTKGSFNASQLFTAEVDWLAMWQSLVKSVLSFLGNLVLAILLLVVGWLVIGYILMPILRRVLRARDFDVTVIRFIELSANYFLKIMLIISCIDLLGVQVLSFSAFLAAFGIGVGASVSGFIQNFFAGLILVGQKPVKSGDWIDMFNSVSGTLETIGITHTTLSTPQRTKITVPNSKIVEACVNNYNSSEIMRADIECFVRHTENIKLVRQLFFEACAVESRIRSEPKPVLQISEISLQAVKISCRMFTSQEDYWQVISSMREQLKMQFERYGVQFQIERRELEFTPGPGIKMLGGGHTETSGSDYKDYRTAKPAADDLAKLEELNTHWDSLLESIESARARADEHHKRNHFAKPLKSLRRKFFFTGKVSQVQDSSEEQDDLVETVVNYSKTALQTEAGEHVHQRDGLLGRRDYERRLKRRASRIRKEPLASSTSDHIATGATTAPAVSLTVPAQPPRAASFHGATTTTETLQVPTASEAAAATAATAAAAAAGAPASTTPLTTTTTGLASVRTTGFKSAREHIDEDDPDQSAGSASGGSGDGGDGNSGNSGANVAAQAVAVVAATTAFQQATAGKGK